MRPVVSPLDEANQALVANVRPDGWRNPAPPGVYDLIAIGGGTAGLVSAVGAAGLGARVALVERHLLGGDCLNVGCVPSKALLRSARAAADANRAAQFGIRVPTAEPDFAAIMQRMRARRATISPHDAASRLHTLGVDVYFGEARFLGTDALDVDGQRLRFKRAVIATGGRAALPPVPGLSSVPILTNETLFSLTERPARLAVIGAGPIGCEMAQAFARFGSAVTVFDMSPRVLPREDADAAAVIEAALERDGVVLALGVTLLDIAHARGAFRIGFQNTSGVREAAFDQVLVCAGRAPNLEQLDLTAAAVSYTTDGVQVDERLRTSNHRIYAAGDVCSQFKFTHAADAMARIVIHNALFFGRKRASALTIPWCTYTDPEVAHVGINQLEARERGPSVATITIALADVDRAIVDDATAGFVRIHHERGRLLGCTVVASHAGEMIGEVAYAMTHKGSLSNLSATIHPYPTQAEAFRKAGDAYRRAAVTPTVSRWLRRYFAWTR